MVQSRGAMGTVEGCGGYGGGVRWVQWRGAVGTVEGCGRYRGDGIFGGGWKRGKT